MRLSKNFSQWLGIGTMSVMLAACSTIQPQPQPQQPTVQGEPPAQPTQSAKPSKPAKPPQLTQIYIDPNPSVGSARAIPGLVVNLSVHDLRAQQFLMSIHYPDQEQAKLVSSANNVRLAIYKAIKKSLTDRGITIDDNAPNQLQIDIISLQSKATQNTLSYVAIDQVTLKATFKSKSRQVVRQYTASRRNTGSLEVDVSAQQNQLNQTLDAVLTGLLTDHKLLDQDQE
ncbi:YajG family lipoprotein [Celerinatantimonas yamalensis]|uniref:YajG family lipoprotein n=1 Tax=Celerinatantimonas yamalensis TaxID=559956 RepID=A0ABW9G9H9_9GAMM